MPCGSCHYFVPKFGYRLFYDGYCTLLMERKFDGDYYKGVNSYDSCNHFLPLNTVKYGEFIKIERGKRCLILACVDYYGKPDDCEELTKMRAFRDNFMKSTDYGKKLLDEYYRVAPEIVAKIDSLYNKDIYYRYIYNLIILCIKAIDDGKNDDALLLCKKMIDKYKKEFSV